MMLDIQAALALIVGDLVWWGIAIWLLADTFPVLKRIWKWWLK